MPPNDHDIGAGELEVLRALWNLGPSTVREVLERVRSKKRDLAYNTVQTVLGRLVEKGFVTRDDSTHRHVFRARVTRDQLGRRRIRDVLHTVYDGAAGSMAMQLLRSGRLEPGEIDELQSMLEELARKRRR